MFKQLRMKISLKQKLGVCLLDLPRYELVLRYPDIARQLFGISSWMDLANRFEHLVYSEDGTGVLCDWKWTSDLFICKVFPKAGSRIMAAAIADWSVTFSENPVDKSAKPLVSFIIGHRGLERKPHLFATLKTIFAQKGVETECLVVEQSVESVLSDLPSIVQHVHTPPPSPDMPFCRSWAFNVGAGFANGQVLIFHDNDVCVPEMYASEVVRIFEKFRVDVVQLQRFIFYLNRNQTDKLISNGQMDLNSHPDNVRQNLHGMTIAVKKDAYFELGGHDEAFIGWGGEDNEFYERCLTRKHYMYGHLPMIHLYHSSQPEKIDKGRSTTQLLTEKSKIKPQVRIDELCSRDWGSFSGPTGATNV